MMRRIRPNVDSSPVHAHQAPAGGEADWREPNPASDQASAVPALVEKITRLETRLAESDVRIAGLEEEVGVLKAHASLEKGLTEIMKRFTSAPAPEVVAEAKEQSAPAARELEPTIEKPLTQRELEVLQLLPLGWTNAAIGDHLCISPKTVNSHLESIFEKLGVGSRTAAVTRANQLGLLDLGMSAL